MKTNLLKLKRAFSYVLCVLLTGSLAIAKANPQSNNQILNETFESYTVGNKIASEANLAGNNWWTTWSSEPGSSEDGVVAEYNDTKCGFVSGSTDQVILLGGYEEGIFNLELDVLIPNEKTGYFNILHSFSGGSSKWALEAYLHYQGNESNPYHGLINVGGGFNGDAPVVYDEWMHFRININMGTDVAILYYSSESTYTEEQQICQWQWSTNAGGDTYGPKLDGMDFFCPLNTSEFYIDNISLSYDDSYIPTTPIIDGIKYSINEDGTSVTVEGLAPNTTASGDLNIPATITINETQYDVTKIASEAFSNTGFNGTLTLPSSITFIGESAFYHSGFTTLNYNITNLEYDEDDYYGGPFYGLSNSLTTLNIGDNVETIPANMFNFFTSLTGTLTIPESMTSIGRNAFYRTAFTTINYNAINCEMGAQFDELENTYTYECVFGWCQNLETLNIGENVQVIPTCAFNVYYGFTGDLVIPNSVTTIGNYAFAETGFNGTMTMSNAVTSIGAYAFYNTQFSGTLTIPSSVTHIGSGAFYGTGYTTLNYNIPNYDEEITSSYDGPFSGMNSLTTLNIGNNVEVIPNYMFNITSLTGDLDIPNSVTTIGNYAFAETGFNGSLIIPNSVTYIGSSAFAWTDFDGTLTLGNSVTSIGEHAFGGVGFTGNLVIPNSVQTIANGAFAGCGFDGTLTLGNSVTSIGEYAFGSVSFTGDLVIPNSVLTIGEEAFVGCEGFTGNLTIGNAVTSIGNSAFNDCYGFSGSLIIGNSVETIGNSAFKGCGGFKGELTLPETVTYIGDGAFRSCDEITKVNYNATNCTYMGNSNSPVFYDCVSINQINIGENVENIPNYAFKRCSNVTSMNVAATVPPTIYSSTFGTVSRSIPVSVPFGTREVYRTAPYWSEFINISDDYTPTQYDYHWSVNVNQFSSDMTVIGVIQINGVEQENLALEIGAFCGSECRGRQMLTYYPQIDRYQVLLMLYGEDGDVFSFRLYNHENEEELLLGSENEITFETNASLGLPLNPYVFNFISMQTTALNSGWSWYSTYIEQNNINGLEMLENSLGEAGLMIQSRNNGYVETYEYNNNVAWYGTLNSIVNEQMYKVHTNASCNVMMTGLSATMSNHPITINNGWNWIGFPSGHNLSVNTALAGMTPEINDIIKGRNGYATYISYNENNFWYGTLNVLEPGQGYMYLSNSETPKTLVYQTGNRDANLLDNVLADGNIFKPLSDRFADNMTITAIVELDEVELKSENYELAAFVGDECRGSVKLMYVEPFNRYVAFLTVFGEQTDEMRFILADDNNVLNSTEKIVFVNDGVVGNLMDPAIIHFGTLSVENENSQAISVYPNPTSGLINIYCNDVKRIEVINAVGQIVMDMNVVDDSVSIDLSNQNDGVYMLRVITDNEIIVKRIIKE